ncbi:MAG: hypothetical protein JW776_05635 [Candidatus Lokiarchaeota archaeon]|nr:hypothetical protein [Candidatus Lokiarchaeota archaeon]
MNSEEVLLLFILISSVMGLVINILFFRFVFRKQTRLRANTFSWLCNIGIMLAINFLLNFILVRDVDTGGIGGAIAFPLMMMFFVTPIMAVASPSLWASIRAIYIAATKNRDRIVERKHIPESKHG